MLGVQGLDHSGDVEGEVGPVRAREREELTSALEQIVECRDGAIAEDVDPGPEGAGEVCLAKHLAVVVLAPNLDLEWRLPRPVYGLPPEPLEYRLVFLTNWEHPLITIGIRQQEVDLGRGLRRGRHG